MPCTVTWQPAGPLQLLRLEAHGPLPCVWSDPGKQCQKQDQGRKHAASVKVQLILRNLPA